MVFDDFVNEYILNDEKKRFADNYFLWGYLPDKNDSFCYADSAGKTRVASLLYDTIEGHREGLFQDFVKHCESKKEGITLKDFFKFKNHSKDDLIRLADIENVIILCLPELSSLPEGNLFWVDVHYNFICNISRFMCNAYLSYKKVPHSKKTSS